MNTLNKLYSQLDKNRFYIADNDLNYKLNIKKEMEFSKKNIRNAIAFDFGYAENLTFDPIYEHVILPYPTLWAEFEAKSVIETIYIKLALLCVQIDEGFEWQCFQLIRGKWSFIDHGVTYPMRTYDKTQYNTEAIFLDKNSTKTIGMLYRALTILACKNVIATEEKPSKLKQQLCKNKKIPIYSNWTLRIVNNKKSNESLGGSHNSPRVHLRRGHIREYLPGRFTWVQPCVVGDKDKGFVHKDYRL